MHITLTSGSELFGWLAGGLLACQSYLHLGHHHYNVYYIATVENEMVGH